jgi:superfamily II DNA or RNA helicase
VTATARAAGTAGTLQGRVQGPVEVPAHGVTSADAGMQGVAGTRPTVLHNAHDTHIARHTNACRVNADDNFPDVQRPKESLQVPAFLQNPTSEPIRVQPQVPAEPLPCPCVPAKPQPNRNEVPPVSANFAPRPYQAAAIQALTAGWQGPHNRLAVVLPTGAGKTVVFSNLIRECRSLLKGHRALVIAHREELIAQAAAKIRAICPELRVGIVKAERDEHQDVDVIVASIQTLAVERRRNAITGIGMVIVDECHHAAAPTYMEVLDHFGAWRGVPVAGFTATLTRSDGGLADVWQNVVYRLDILDMISDGYLVDVRGKRVHIDGLNLDTVKTRNGDFQDGQLAQALDDSGASDIVADAYRNFAPDRPGVVFTPTVNTAHGMTAALNTAGIPAATIWGDMPKDERAATLERYRTGDLQVLANCMVLTEGFDAPWTSCVVIARPTKSAGLYCQMAGRALRLSEGKKNALILDVMGASTRHKLASIVDLTERELDDIDDDKPLAEAIRDADEAEASRKIQAAIEWEEFNLFDSSPTRWLRTDDGTWFVPLTFSMFLFLVPGEQPGTYRVRRWDQPTGARAPQPDQEMPLPDAMVWTERQARALAPRTFIHRAAAWRSGTPSSKQRGWCRFHRLPIPAGATAGDVADLQDLHRVSQILRAAPHSSQRERGQPRLPISPPRRRSPCPCPTTATSNSPRAATATSPPPGSPSPATPPRCGPTTTTATPASLRSAPASTPSPSRSRTWPPPSGCTPPSPR